MNRCPGCDYIVPGAWTECRRCGAPLPGTGAAPEPAPAAAASAAPSTANLIGALALAPPPPVAPFLNGHTLHDAPPASASGAPGYGAPDDALLPGAAPRDVGPDTMLPVEPLITVAPPRRLTVEKRTVAIVAIVLMCVIGAAFSFIPHGSHGGHAAPVFLTPQAPYAGIPTSLGAIVRIEAESSRHTALSDVISAASPNAAPLTLSQLAEEQPAYQWVLGNVPSTTNTMISITSTYGSDVIAVSGTNRTICAYGRWTPTAGSTYVTMDNVRSCTAITAPDTGWSTLAGGSAQDLPGEDGS